MSSIKVYKVGIGITTKDRPKLLKELLDSIYKYTDMSNIMLHIEDDSIERLGVAKRKNLCLKALKHCEAIFLLDDDVKIIKNNWIDFFIESRYHHLLYLNNTHNYFKSINSNAKIYHDCGGVFMFMTKEVIETVGAFNEEFELWGFEHAEYSQRIFKAGLTVAPYICLNQTGQYIYSEDYSNPMHKSSITNEEKNYLFNKNKYIFAQPITTIYRPL